MSDAVTHEIYGDYGSIVTSQPAWTIATFALPDDSTWEYREPDAVAVVQNGRLRLAARRFTRHHDTIQILDNPKHMFFSTRTFEVPDGGGITFELDLRAQGISTAPGDLYDGFATFNLLDFNEGIALDWVCSDDRIAPVFARLPFPGVNATDTKPLKYFAIFEELEHDPQSRQRVRIDYDRASAEAVWWLDGVERWRHHVPVDLQRFTLALGVFTEKDLTPNGSVSCHGQGLVAEWGPIAITTWQSSDGSPFPR